MDVTRVTSKTVTGERARVSRSRCTVTPAESEWRVHEFWVCGGGGGGGEALCRCAALRMRGSLLLWLGAGAGGGGAPQLGGAALGSPAGRTAAGAAGALATPLLGADEAAAAAAALARRLAAALARPVFVFCGASFNRFTSPLVERGLVAEIKKWDM